jgi:hypothetical protein
VAERVEHEFAAEDNKTLIKLSEELYRFSVLTGVVGLAMIGLGVAALILGGYRSPLSAPAFIIMGIIAMIGGGLFMRPKVGLEWIPRTWGTDVTRLMDALRYLDRAHALFRILLIALVVVRIVSYLLVHAG